MDDLIEIIDDDLISDDIPEMSTGDKVRVQEQVEEGSSSRIQIFEGVLLKRSGSGSREMVTVRKIASGVGVEKTFPLHSPKIKNIEVVEKKGVRQSRPYYLREEK